MLFMLGFKGRGVSISCISDSFYGLGSSPVDFMVGLIGYQLVAYLTVSHGLGSPVVVSMVGLRDVSIRCIFDCFTRISKFCLMLFVLGDHRGFN